MRYSAIDFGEIASFPRNDMVGGGSIEMIVNDRMENIGFKSKLKLMVQKLAI